MIDPVQWGASMNKPYRECVAEITAVLKKYDMAGAITVVSKDRAMFKYHFPTWSVITLEPNAVRFRAKREEFSSKEAQRVAIELSAHIVMQMRDVAANTFTMMEEIGKKLEKEVGLEHTPNVDFDPEYDQ